MDIVSYLLGKNSAGGGGADLSQYFTDTISKGTQYASGLSRTIKKVPNLTISGTSAEYMFSNYYGTSLDINFLDTSSITTMANMFDGCENLTELKVNSLDVKNVKTMTYVFRGCAALTELDLSSWETNELQVTGFMFVNCLNLRKLDIRNFNLSNVSNYNYMFGVDGTNGPPNNCLIIVKDDTQKTWITSKFGRLTNVKTVAEYEG